MLWIIVHFVLAVMLGSFATYLLLQGRKKSAAQLAATALNNSSNTFDFGDTSNDSFKMVLLIRTDLNMGKGKIAAQCCHATLAAYKEALVKSAKFLKQWEQEGQAKVTLKVESEQDLNELLKQAKQSGIVGVSIRDAGRTQVASGTKTVGAIGPAPARLIDCITGHLKLY